MKRLVTTSTKDTNFFTRVRRVVTISVNSSVNLDKNVFKCWVCDYRGRNIRRIIRRFGSYTQLQKWDATSGRADLERFADLFDEVQPEEGTRRYLYRKNL